jgi:AbrB family looped-hinge helix DNA binding protein
MNVQTTTVSTKGQLVIPAEIRAELGIEPGTKIAITVEGSRIVLQPVTERLIDEMHGVFQGGSSATDELIEERRADERRRQERWPEK